MYYCLRDLVGWGKIKESLLQDYARRFHLAMPYVRLVEGLWGLDRGLPEDIPTAWKNLTEVSGDAAAILEVPIALRPEPSSINQLMTRTTAHTHTHTRHHTHTRATHRIGRGAC